MRTQLHRSYTELKRNVRLSMRFEVLTDQLCDRPTRSISPHYQVARLVFGIPALRQRTRVRVQGHS